ncbi:hypothetical protein AAMO2058_001418200 [Amorphochlora amoebiformis]
MAGKTEALTLMKKYPDLEAKKKNYPNSSKHTKDTKTDIKEKNPTPNSDYIKDTKTDMKEKNPRPNPDYIKFEDKYNSDAANELFQRGFDFHWGRNFKYADKNRGKKLILQAIQQGSNLAKGYAYYILAWNGFSKDFNKAASLILSEAQSGNLLAQAILGKCYQYGGRRRRGGIRDYAKAISWIKKSAEQGCPYAQYRLGCCYKLGTGHLQRNIKEALKGMRMICRPTGKRYLEIAGDHGDSSEITLLAFYWFVKSAKQGNVKARYHVGMILLTGREGIPPNPTRGFETMLQNAERKNDHFTRVIQWSRYEVGKCFENGIGVEKDLKEAKYWYAQQSKPRVATALEGRDIALKRVRSKLIKHLSQLKEYCNKALLRDLLKLEMLHRSIQRSMGSSILPFQVFTVHRRTVVGKPQSSIFSYS